MRFGIPRYRLPRDSSTPRSSASSTSVSPSSSTPRSPTSARGRHGTTLCSSPSEPGSVSGRTSLLARPPTCSAARRRSSSIGAPETGCPPTTQRCTKPRTRGILFNWLTTIKQVDAGKLVVDRLPRNLRRRRHGALRAIGHCRGRSREARGPQHRRMVLASRAGARRTSEPGHFRHVEHLVLLRRSARRCMSCGNCFSCDNCYGVCPDNAVIKLGAPGEKYLIDLDYCKGCGLCVAECPSGAIQMSSPRRSDCPDRLAGPMPGLTGRRCSSGRSSWSRRPVPASVSPQLRHHLVGSKSRDAAYGSSARRA
jgi:Pyruvate/2-oxoacid:ferredoxin oxidoreductase delta subunit